MPPASLRRALAAALCLAGCDVEAPPPAPPAVPPPPPPDRVGTPLRPALTRLFDVEAEVVLALPAGRALIGGPAGSSLVEGSTLTALPELGRVASAASVAGEVLVAGDGGLFALRGAALTPSLLSPLVAAPVELLNRPTPGGETLWLAGAEGLFTWSMGQVTELRPGDLPRRSARLAPGSGEEVAVWVLAGGALYGIDPSGARATVVPAPGPVELLAAPTDGRLYFTVAGSLYSRDATGAVRAHDAVRGVRFLLAAPGSPRLVLGAADGLWIREAGAFLRVEGASAAAAAELSNGDLLILGPGGLVHVALGPPVVPQVPTWGADIAPLFAQRCAACHGSRGTARRLDTRERWMSEIDAILFNVREQRMPLPPARPLGAAELALIDGWKDGGFAE